MMQQPAMHSTAKTALSFTRVAYSHAARLPELLSDLTFAVTEGSCTAFVGRSGCGKSTILRLIAGLATPTSGAIAKPAKVRMVWQQDGLLPWLSVADNILLGVPRQARAEAAARSRELLQAFHLQPSALSLSPRHLSGGQRQRVEMVRAFLPDDAVLLLDEPFSGLDYFTRKEVRVEAFTEARRRGKTVILVTHDLDEALETMDQIIVLGGDPTTIQARLQVPAVGTANSEFAKVERQLKDYFRVPELRGPTAGQLSRQSSTLGADPYHQHADGLAPQTAAGRLEKPYE